MTSEHPGQHGVAARDGITDVQDEVLTEMGEVEAADEDRRPGVNEAERRYGDSESPS